jgi:hypothetical protein
MIGSHPNLAIPRESHLYDNTYPVVHGRAYLTHETTRVRVVSEILRNSHIKNWKPSPTLSETLAAITRHTSSATVGTWPVVPVSVLRPKARISTGSSLATIPYGG